MILNHTKTINDTMPFSFKFPTQSKPQTDVFYTNPKRTKMWIDALPLANLPKTTQLLFDLLSEANEHVISPRQRFHLLEILRQPANHVINAIDNAIDSSRTTISISPPIANKQLATASHSLLEQMAMGFKIVLRDLHFMNGQTSIVHRSIVRKSITRAIYYLGHASYVSYFTSSIDTASLWCEIYSLYRLAVNNKIAKTTTNREKKHSLDKCNITNTYKQTLLLAINYTSRMRKGDIHAISPLLPQWARLCSLAIATQSDHRATKLFNQEKSINDSNPCTPVDKLAVNDADQPVWVLDTRQLTVFLRSNCQSASLLDKLSDGRNACTKNTLPSYLIADILENLAEYETTVHKQRPTRISVDKNIDISIGLFNIYNCLHTIAYHDFQEDKGDQELIIISNTHDAWISNQLRRNTTQQHIIKASLLEESAGGCRIGLDTNKQDGLQAGTLIATRHTSNFIHPEPWTIGVVRWQSQTERTSFEAGIKYFAGTPQGFLATPCPEGPNEHQENLRIVLLPAAAVANQPEIVILPHGQLTNTKYLHLLSRESEILVKLGRCLEDTGLFMCYEVTRAQHCGDNDNESSKTKNNYNRQVIF